MSHNLRKMISYYKGYLPVFFLDLFFAFLSAGVSLVLPLIIRHITQTIGGMESGDALNLITRMALLMAFLLLVQWVSTYYISYMGHVMGVHIERDMRAEIFAHFQRLSLSFYDSRKVGSLMSRITHDLFDITELMHHGPENIILSVFKIIGAFIILAGISWRLSLAAFFLVPFMAVFAVYYNKRMKTAFRRNRERVAEINAQIEDNLSGIRVVKSFANEKVEEGKFKIGNEAFVDSKTTAYRYMGGYQSGLTTFTTGIQVLVVLAGGLGIAAGTVSVSDLVTFLLYIGVFTEPIRTLINFTEQFQSGYTGFERFREIVELVPEIQDAPDAQPLPPVKGDIAFENVSFRYEENKQSVLSSISLEIPAGAYIALVGPSGAGKSTLCSLIPRFYDVTGGSITIDGRDIRTVTTRSLREQIGIVQQDVYLFGGTVYENILYGRPGASREEVIAAAKNANAHDFIMGLPNGYDTDIGQRGVKLSGGQKQRLSIARVFLKNPPILIFDEATSALDNESEKVVQDSLEKLAKNRTTLVIAHRLSTIRNAERILVLTENGIEESGSHRQLLDRHGIYEHLYQMQFT